MSGTTINLDLLKDYEDVLYHRLEAPSNFVAPPEAMRLSYRGTIQDGCKNIFKSYNYYLLYLPQISIYLKFALRYKESDAQLEAVAVKGENLATMARWPFIKVFVFPGVRGKQKSPTQNK